MPQCSERSWCSDVLCLEGGWRSPPASTMQAQANQPTASRKNTLGAQDIFTGIYSLGDDCQFSQRGGRQQFAPHMGWRAGARACTGTRGGTRVYSVTVRSLHRCRCDAVELATQHTSVVKWQTHWGRGAAVLHPASRSRFSREPHTLSWDNGTQEAG